MDQNTINNLIYGFRGNDKSIFSEVEIQALTELVFTPLSPLVNWDDKQVYSDCYILFKNGMSEKLLFVVGVEIKNGSYIVHRSSENNRSFHWGDKYPVSTVQHIVLLKGSK